MKRKYQKYSPATKDLVMEIFTNLGTKVSSKHISEYVCKKQKRPTIMLSGVAIKKYREEFLGNHNTNIDIAKNTNTDIAKTYSINIKDFMPFVRGKSIKYYKKILPLLQENPNIKFKEIQKNLKKVGVTYNSFISFRKKYQEYENANLVTPVKRNLQDENLLTPVRRKKNLQYTTVFEKEALNGKEDPRILIQEVIQSMNTIFRANLELVETTFPEKKLEIRYYSK